MTMHWTSYLVRVHPEVDTMDERMERAHRSEVITEGFIRPQADEIALAYETKNVFQRLIQDITSYGTTDPNRIITHLAPHTYQLAIQDQREQIPCVAPYMMWDYLYEVVRETLSPKPSKEEIKQLRKTCIALLDDGIDRDPKIVKEIYRTIGVTNTVLEEWFINEHHPLRFYAEKPNWFDRYSI